MKRFCFIPLMFLTACSTAPKLALRPQLPPPATDNSTVRYPEVVRAYHFGRYIDPDNGLVMHEQHTVYRVEENTRWNLHSAPPDGFSLFSSSLRDSAFAPAPVNDEVLAEVNAQRLATAQIMMEGKILAAALQQLEQALQDARKNEQATVKIKMTVEDLDKRLHALETSPASTATTNEPADSLVP
jgi:hypothetical protein